MSSSKLSQWIGNKAKDLRDAIGKLQQELEQWSGRGELQPIPIRVEDPNRRRQRR